MQVAVVTANSNSNSNRSPVTTAITFTGMKTHCILYESAPEQLSALKGWEKGLAKEGAVPIVVPVLAKKPSNAVPTTLIQRPVAVRPVPVPARVMRLFYQQAQQQGLDESHVHEAVAESNEWHRKWSMQQEESESLAPEEEAPQEPDSAYLAAVMDRGAGAKNPSPQVDEEETGIRRERLFSLDLPSQGDQSSLSSMSTVNDNEGRYCFVGLVTDQQAVPTVLQEAPAKTNTNTTLNTTLSVVRPVPGRIARPVAVKPCAAYVGPIPKHIQRTMSRFSNSSSSDCENLSPITLASGMSTDVDTKQAGGADDQSPPKRAIAPSRMAVRPSPLKPQPQDRTVLNARDGILQALAVAGGDVKSAQFQSCLSVLQGHFEAVGGDARLASSFTEGMWLTLTKPTFHDYVGENDEGDPMYTLGRMSFDMFSPTNVICSLQGNFNSVERVSNADRAEMIHLVPKGLNDEVESGESLLRTYTIVTAFSIEPSLAGYPDAPNKDVRRPIRGIMTTNGYTLPDPENPNRHSVWITGGKIEANNDLIDQREWKRQFGRHPPKHKLGEKAKLLAVKLLMGATLPEKMNEQGIMEYTFTRPLGGHGTAYVDTLYLDDTLRIVRGHRGTVFVFMRMPGGTD